jgi:hypothetical protein
MSDGDEQAQNRWKHGAWPMLLLWPAVLDKCCAVLHTDTWQQQAVQLVQQQQQQVLTF